MTLCIRGLTPAPAPGVIAWGFLVPYYLMSLDWRLRLTEWQAVLKKEHRKGSWKGMLKAILSGPVPRRVWQSRMRICLKCPIYNPTLKQCRCPIRGFEHMGCGCYAPFEAMWSAPYPKGCWAAQDNQALGWPAYRRSGSWPRTKAVLGFLLGR